LAALQGDLCLAILVIFPVIIGEGALPAIGGILLFSGFVALFLSFAIGFQGAGVDGTSEGDAEGGISGAGPRSEYEGVVLIGPVPIILGSNRRMALAMAIITLVALAVILMTLLFQPMRARAASWILVPSFLAFTRISEMMRR